MGRIAEDLTGKTFGSWTVIKKAERISKGDALWHCECVCKTRNIVRAHGLRKGLSKSCGCMRSKVNNNMTKKERIWGKKDEKI